MQPVLRKRLDAHFIANLTNGMTNGRDAYFLNNKGIRILVAVLAFLASYLVSYILDPFAAYWQDYFERKPLLILGDWLVSFLYCLSISEINIAIGMRLNRLMSWKEHPGKRLFLETCFNLIAVLLLNLLINIAFIYLSDEKQLLLLESGMTIEETRGIIQWMVVSTIIAIMIMGINIGNYLIMNWRNEAIQVAQLNQAAMEAELQSLKLQIDPHFVFNNLSVLSELILEDQQLGYEYAENFSRIYRYMLVNSKKDVIPLEDELKFLNSYMFLIEHRFGEGVLFEIDVDPSHRPLLMPPLTLQLLVENALKHNRTSKKEPLVVRIFSNEDKELIVENTLLPLEKTIQSSGIGIANIVRRFNLLSHRQPVIEADEHTFKVIIPLIKI